jgi:hypothetical protein
MFKRRRAKRTRNAIRIMCHGDTLPCEKYIEDFGGLLIEHRCKAAKEQGKKHAEYGTVVIE